MFPSDFGFIQLNQLIPLIHFINQQTEDIQFLISEIECGIVSFSLN